MFIGKLLMEARDNLGSSQESLADQIGISNKKLSKWERGDFNPSLKELKQLSLYFDIPISKIVGEDVEKKQTYEDVSSSIIIDSAFPSILSNTFNVYYLLPAIFLLILSFFEIGIIFIALLVVILNYLLIFFIYSVHYYSQTYECFY